MKPSTPGIACRPRERSAFPGGIRPTLSAWALLLLTACSADHYRQAADEEVYHLIESTQQQTLGAPRDTSIEPTINPIREQLLEPPQRDQSLESRLARKLPQDDALFQRLHSLSLDDALVVAAEGREYQQAKESVFLRGLDLTFQQYLFTNRWFGLVNTEYRRIGPGENGNRSTEVVDGSVDTGFVRTLKQGAQVTVSLLASFLRQITNPGDTSSSSLLGFAITQPLLRGSGKVVEEPLVQAERNLIYSVRDFERFRRSLAVQVARDYFNTVQSETELRNERRNKDRLRLQRERAEAMAEAGRLPQFQVDQASQNELRADTRVIAAEQRLQSQLDNLKLTLSLPTDSEINPRAGVYEELTQSGLEPMEMGEEEALDIALKHRLDLETARNRVEDAERQIVVTEDALQAGLDVSAAINLGTRPKQPIKFDTDISDYSAGLQLDLPFDRLRERNAYRASLINLEQRRRELSDLEDQIKLQVRDSLRTLTTAAENYRIQQTSAELARRRVDSTTDLLQAGRSTTRDLLDAQDALIQAQNALARALIDHRIALLEFQRDLETLPMPERGLTNDRP